MKRKRENKNNSPKKKQKMDKNYFWSSHGETINDMFILPKNVNIIFLTEIGVSCHGHEMTEEIVKQFYNDIPIDILEHDTYRSSVDLFQFRNIYKPTESKYIPNMKLWWSQNDLLNPNMCKFMIGLSEIPLNPNKFSGTILNEEPRLEFKATLKELVEYVSKMNLNNNHNIFIWACRTSYNDTSEFIMKFYKRYEERLKTNVPMNIDDDLLQSLLAQNSLQSQGL